MQERVAEPAQEEQVQAVEPVQEQVVGLVQPLVLALLQQLGLVLEQSPGQELEQELARGQLPVQALQFLPLPQATPAMVALQVVLQLLILQEQNH